VFRCGTRNLASPQRYRLKLGDPIRSLAFSADGRVVAACTQIRSRQGSEANSEGTALEAEDGGPRTEGGTNQSLVASSATGRVYQTRILEP